MTSLSSPAERFLVTLAGGDSSGVSGVSEASDLRAGDCGFERVDADEDVRLEGPVSAS